MPSALRLRSLFCLVSCALCLITSVTAKAAPLELIPREAGLLIAIEQPRKLAEAVRDLDAYQSAGKSLPSVREFYDSTPARRFFQLVTFAEKELGVKWPDLLERTAGGGIAIGAVVGTDPAPVLLVARGTDENATAEVFALFLRVVEEESARQANAESKAKLRKATHRGVDTFHLGDDFHAARVGPNVFLANKAEALHAGLKLAVARNPGGSLADRPEPIAAKKLIGGDPFAWLWFDLAAAKSTKASMDFFANSRKDFVQTMAAGTTIDSVRRSDFVAVGLSPSPGGFAFTVRMPAKRADLPPEFSLHVPPPGTSGSLPLLEPPGVLYSQSFYLDFAAFWANRAKIINAQQLKDIEKAERDISRVLPGTTLAKLFAQSGPYHRFVMAHNDEKLYPGEPIQPIPPFAFVSTFRDPAFAKGATNALRAGGLLASTQLKLSMKQEAVDGVTIVSYRYPDVSPYPDGDTENYRFNFVPAFAIVGDNLVVSSRPSLVKTLIPILKQKPDPAKCSPEVWRAKVYANGFGDVMKAYPEQTITATILNEGVGLEQARKQVTDLIGWLRTLGTVEIALDHQTSGYLVRVEWKTK